MAGRRSSPEPPPPDMVADARHAAPASCPRPQERTRATRLGRAPERGIVEAEARGAAAGVGACVPTLYFADRERKEAVLCELLVGFNDICHYEQQ
ncbi:hypothetical protein ZWY2020_018625 [Hordeum vulgare]|nr:hypothetical protein ZWY2020_018625 [Hordeum vulgare]